jgi:hypothetical protein
MAKTPYRFASADAMGPAGSMGAAIATLARREAVKAAKRQLQRQGVRPAHVPAREIGALADTYLAEHRTQLIAEARAFCAKLTSDAQRAKPRKSITSAVQISGAE